MNCKDDNILSFYFARHGVTEQNIRGLRCGGDLDVPLTEDGCRQAFQLGERIRSMNVDIGVILTSPLVRTRQTALLISGVLAATPVIDSPLLSERCLGDWNKCSIAETEQQLQDQQTPPGGESELLFRQRMQSALEWIQPYFDQQLLLVGSKGVGRMLYSVLGGSDRLSIENGELLRFDLCSSCGGRQGVCVHRYLLP